MTTVTETSVLELPPTSINLQPGERYAGVTLDGEGRIKHHVILLPNRLEEVLPWQKAMEWAESVGGQLPTRQEQSLLFANCKPHIVADWYWSCEESESGSYAWICYFSAQLPARPHESFEGSAVAVRRLNS